MYQTKKFISELVEKHGKKTESLMPILQAAAKKYGYINDELIVNIASELDVSSAQVFGTASFYSFLDTEKRGKYIIRVCNSIIAVMKGKDEIIKAIEEMLNIEMGETTPDNRFTLLETSDIGWSDKEPSMLINDKVYTELTPQKTIAIIDEYLNN